MPTAASLSTTDVQAALNAAGPGDFVYLPAGVITWSSASVSWTAPIHVRGAGVGLTDITFTINNARAFNFTGPSTVANLTGRVTGDSGTAFIDVDLQDWRIFECEFWAPKTDFGDAIQVSQKTSTLVRGVIHDCVFHDTRVNVSPFLNMAGMHALWAGASVVGTINTTFVEDCEFRFTKFGNCIDANYGGSYVFRHNTVYNTPCECHSFQGGNARGTKSVEIYENEFIVDLFDLNYPCYIRGGEFVWYNNIIRALNGYQWTNPHGFVNDVRGAENRGGVICLANGEWPLVDGNEAEPNGTGTHNGADGAVDLLDTTKSWSVDQWVRTEVFCAVGGVGCRTFSRWVYNLTTGAKGQISDNDATHAVAAMSGGSRQTWNAGDSYKITGGYAARDQIGRGPDVSLSSGEAGTSQWAAQVSKPGYSWNNRYGSAGGAVMPIEPAGDYPGHLIEGRDFYNTPRPGWVAPAYPHELREDLAAPTFIVQPEDRTVLVGSSVTFTAFASGNPSPALQWFKDDVIISGATSTTYVIDPVLFDSGGEYTCVATNSQGTDTSAVATLVVGVVSEGGLPSGRRRYRRPVSFAFFT